MYQVYHDMNRWDKEQVWRNKHRENYLKKYEGCWEFKGVYYGDQFKQEKLQEGLEIIHELERMLEMLFPTESGETVLIKRLLPELNYMVRYELYDDDLWQEGRDIIGFDF